MPVGAALGAAGITAAGSVIGGHEAASGAQAGAAAQERMYNTTRNDLMPYNQGGQQDFSLYNKLLSGSPSQVQAQLEGLPGYQFTRQQTLKAVQNSAAARGLGVSGASYKGAANYAAGLADTTFGEQANRLLAGATLGENAGAQTGSAGAYLGRGVGSALTDAGAAQAAGWTGAGKALGNGLYQYGYGMYAGGAPGVPGPGYVPATDAEVMSVT